MASLAVDLTNTADTQSLWDQILGAGATAYGASGLPDPFGVSQSVSQTLVPSSIQPVTVTPMQTLPTASGTPATDNSIFDTAGSLLGYVMQQAGAGVYAVADAAGNMIGLLYNSVDVPGGIDAVSATGAYVGKFIVHTVQEVGQIVQKNVVQPVEDAANTAMTYLKYGAIAVGALIAVLVLVEVIKVVED